MKKTPLILLVLFITIGLFAVYQFTIAKPKATAMVVKEVDALKTFETKPINETCYTTEQREINGGSLSGIVEHGETVNVHFGYYDCNEIKRNDIAIYNYGNRENPIGKVVKAIPGDKWHLKQNGNTYNIIVNDKPVRNAQEKVYEILKIKMLQLYTKDYPTLPNNTYLILGNLVHGTTDSTQFGLVHKNDILGKLELI